MKKLGAEPSWEWEAGRPDAGAAAHAPRLEGVPQRGEAARIYRRIGLGLAVTDGLCLIVALSLSYLVRFGLEPLPQDWLIAAAISPFLWVAIFHLFRLNSPHLLSGWEEFSRTVSASCVGIVVVALMSYWSKSSFSRIWIGLTWVSALLLELLARQAWRGYVRRRKASGELAFRTLIIGSNREAARLEQELAAPGSGYAPVGCVRVAGPSLVEDGIHVVGNLDNLADCIAAYSADCLFAVSSDLRSEDMNRIVQVARQTGTDVSVSAGIPEMLAPRLTVQSVGSFMALSLRPVRLTRAQAIAKRVFDLLLAVPGLILVSPILVATAIAIRLDSRGPVFFTQARATKGGKIFDMVKFRTMYPNADELLRDVDVNAPFFKVEDDPRLTRVGRIIRKLSVDELPQLWNVIKGEMSLVGPRPLPAEQIALHRDLLAPRLEVQAGMTGWWQVHGRSNLKPEDSVKLDIFYIENWSLTLDLYILLKTIGAVFRGTGAY